MNTQLITLLALVAASAAARPNYDFAYTVRDGHSGNDFGHQEARELDNTVGSYYVNLPDGRLQQVSYRVHGGSGYLAEVSHKGEAYFPDSDSYESLESRELHKPRYSSESIESQEVAPPSRFSSRPRSGSFFSGQKYRSSARPITSFFRLGSVDSSESYEHRYDSSGSDEHRYDSSDSDEHRYDSSDSDEHRYDSSDSDEHRYDTSDSYENYFDSSDSHENRFYSRDSPDRRFYSRESGKNFLRLGSRTYYY